MLRYSRGWGAAISMSLSEAGLDCTDCSFPCGESSGEPAEIGEPGSDDDT